MNNIMNLLGMEYRETTLHPKKYSNYSSSELTALSQAVITANQKIVDAKKALEDIEKKYNIDKAVANSLGPEKEDCGIWYRDSTAGFGETKFGATHFIVQWSSPKLTEDRLVNTCGNTNFYSVALLQTRLEDYKKRIANTKTAITNAETTFNDANKKYQDALKTLSPQQQVTLQAETQAIINAQTTSNVKKNIMIGGAIIGGLAVVTWLFIFLSKREKAV